MTKIEAQALASNIRAQYSYVEVAVLPAPLASPDSPLLYQLALRRGALVLFVRTHAEWSDMVAAHYLLRREP